MENARIFYDINVDYFRVYKNKYQEKAERGTTADRFCQIEFKVLDWEKFLSEAIKCNALSIDGLKRFITEYEGKNDK